MAKYIVIYLAGVATPFFLQYGGPAGWQALKKFGYFVWDKVKSLVGK